MINLLLLVLLLGGIVAVWKACIVAEERITARRRRPSGQGSWEYAELPKITLSPDERAWVKHHLLLGKSDPAEWPKIIGDAHGYAGVYWMCPSKGCTATPMSHLQSGCNVQRVLPPLRFQGNTVVSDSFG